MGKTIQFRGQSYSSDDIVTQSRFGGHMQTVDTTQVNDAVSDKSRADKIAVHIDGKYHLLTGTIDPQRAQQQLVVISKIALKKAIYTPPSYTERREQQVTEKREYTQRHGSAPPRGAFGNTNWRR